MPNMNMQIAHTIRPVRMFLLGEASGHHREERYLLRSAAPCRLRLEVDIGDHRAEQQREVGEREQVQLQRRAAVGAAVQAHGAGDEAEPEQQRGDEVDRAEARRRRTAAA